MTWLYLACLAICLMHGRLSTVCTTVDPGESSGFAAVSTSGPSPIYGSMETQAWAREFLRVTLEWTESGIEARLSGPKALEWFQACESTWIGLDITVCDSFEI